MFLDGKYKAKRVSNGSNAIVVLSSTSVCCYVVLYCAIFRACRTNIYKKLVTFRYSYVKEYCSLDLKRNRIR